MVRIEHWSVTLTVSVEHWPVTLTVWAERPVTLMARTEHWPVTLMMWTEHWPVTLMRIEHWPITHGVEENTGQSPSWCGQNTTGQSHTLSDWLGWKDSEEVEGLGWTGVGWGWQCNSNDTGRLISYPRIHQCKAVNATIVLCKVYRLPPPPPHTHTVNQLVSPPFAPTPTQPP